MGNHRDKLRFYLLDLFKVCNIPQSAYYPKFLPLSSVIHDTLTIKVLPSELGRLISSEMVVY